MTAVPCAHCGTPLYADDVYCVGCGEPVGAAPPPPTDAPRRETRMMMAVRTGAHARITSCPGCGGAVFPGDKFCQGCGATADPGLA